MSQLDEPPLPSLLLAVGDPPPRVPRARTAGVAPAVSRRGRGPDRHPPTLDDVVGRVSGRMLPGPTVDRLLDLVTSTAVGVVRAACGAGLTVDRGPAASGRATLAATDALVELLDARQDALDDGPVAFTDPDAQAATMFAAQAAVLVEAARAVRDAGRVGPALQEALLRREVVDRATGIVMARDRIPATAAFAHLVALGHRDGRPVHDVAARLVAAVGRAG